ncbi:MAG: hypothetical protein LQ352_003708 [Teloschistes flavicans]|nr:MAG: hypothetical protein LQ352_003708 [Teloschistes flavicans]
MDVNDHAANVNGFVASNGAAPKPMPMTEQSMNQANVAALGSKESNHEDPQVNGVKEESFTPIQRLQYLDGNLSDDEDWKADPYQERADEIGLSHRIPGIGHLGDLLIPPDWEPGDDPIHPKKARQLHKEACAAARNRLNASMADSKNLKGSAYEEACQLIDEEWQKNLTLNKVIRDERTKVYWNHRDEKKQRIGQDRPEQYPVLNLPRSRGPFGDSSRQVPALVVTKAAESNGGHPSQMVTIPSHFYSNGQRDPSPKLLSPSFLDPKLHDGTVRAAYQKYHFRKAQLAQEAHDNEEEFRQCLERYAPHLIPEAQALYGWEPVFQPQSRWACPQGEHSQYQSNRYPGNHIDYNDGNEIQRPTAYRYPEPPQNTLGVYDEPVELALSSPAEFTHARDDDDENTARPTKRQAKAKGSSPQKPSSRKGMPQKIPNTPAPTPKKPKKSTCWYAAELEKANLPTSTISAEAMQAGYDYNPYGPSRKIQLAAAAAKNGDSANKVHATSKTESEDVDEPSNKPKKKRRKGDEPVPVPAFKMDDDAIKKLFSSGLPVKYIGDGENPWLDQEGPVRAKKSGKTGGNGEVGKPDLAYPSDFSDDSANEDVNDGTYGGGRRKSGTPRKTAVPNIRKRKTMAERA